MKKVFMVLSLLGMLTFIAPKVATTAESDCHTINLLCPNGSQHIVVVCENQDWRAWGEILCGIEYL